MDEMKNVSTEYKNKREEKGFFSKKISIKFLLKILIIVLILLIIIPILKKVIVLKNLQDKVGKYTSKSNYSISVNTYYGEKISHDECLVKDENTYLYTTSLLDEEDKQKRIIFSKDGETNLYIEMNGSKIAELNQGEISTKMEIPNYLQTNDIKDFISLLFKAKITTVKCNGKECYEIRNIGNSNLVYTENGYAIIYVDIETGLIERVVRNNTENKEDIVQDYTYEFDNITDGDIKEPNISEYEVK